MEGFPAFSPNWFAVRLSFALDKLNDKFISGLKLLCQGMVGVEHGDAERKHIHLGIVNATISHDPFRKALVKLVREHLSTELTGNSLMSVKKWNGQEKYVVYMIKGKNALIFNDYITDDYYERLKSQWISKTVVENEYVRWKNTDFYPKPFKPVDPETMCLYTPADYKRLNDDRCDAVWNACIKYAVSFTGGYIDAKGKFLAKNLYSNFCLFNKLKPKVQYI